MAGGRVFEAGLAALAPFGRLVVYGIASREPNEVQLGRAHAPQPGGRRLLARALPAAAPRSWSTRPLQDLFAASRRASCASWRATVYGLSEARRAHEDLQARRTTGKLMLDPAR